jgi:tetratricopeptide (TPR) repeat protein
MHIFRFLVAACLLCVQQARADMYTECDKSCDFANRLAQCRQILKAPDVPNTIKAGASSRICEAHLWVQNYGQDMLDACMLAVELDPIAERYAELGAAKIGRRRYKEAIRALDKAVAMDPALASAYYNRGIAYEMRHKRREALADYKEARRLGHPKAWRSIKQLVRPLHPA